MLNDSDLIRLKMLPRLQMEIVSSVSCKLCWKYKFINAMLIVSVSSTKVGQDFISNWIIDYSVRDFFHMRYCKSSSIITEKQSCCNNRIDQFRVNGTPSIVKIVIITQLWYRLLELNKIGFHITSIWMD
jgi:hypothetical protein